MIDIILNGINGHMGKAIVGVVSERDDCRIVCGVDINDSPVEDIKVYKNISDYEGPASVIIDFSHPSALSSILDYAKEKNLPTVIATTGYSNEQIAEIKDAAKVIPLFFTANMSLGVNLIAELAKKAAAILQHDFDIEIIEKHHNQKLDAPSGTALMLADEISSVMDTEPAYEYDRHSRRAKRPKNEIGIHAVRGGNIVGEHEIIFAGHDEIVTISHSARSKEVFAVGCINAAVFLASKSAGLYNMSNLIG